MIDTETRTSVEPEAKKNLTLSEYMSGVALFVIENLPSIRSLRKMAEDKRGRRLTIGGKEWTLSIHDDQIATASGDGQQDVRYINLSSEGGDGVGDSLGIVTGTDFGLVYGAYSGNRFLRTESPFNLKEIMREMRRVEDANRKTTDVGRDRVLA